MQLDFDLIANILIAMFFYNIFLKAISATILKAMFNSEGGKKIKKTFKERIDEKLNE